MLAHDTHVHQFVICTPKQMPNAKCQMPIPNATKCQMYHTFEISARPTRYCNTWDGPTVLPYTCNTCTRRRERVHGVWPWLAYTCTRVRTRVLEDRYLLPSVHTRVSILNCQTSPATFGDKKWKFSFRTGT